MNSTTNESPIVIFKHLVINEKPKALFKGWLPSYLRLGPHALICFPLFEKIRHILGLDYL